MVTIDELLAPFQPPATHLVDRLRYWTEQQPTETAYYYLVDGDDEEEKLTYEQLDRRARAIGAKLVSLGMAGQRALLLYLPGLDFVCGFFGCLYAGATPVPAYPPRRNRNVSRLEDITEDAQAKAALTVCDVYERMQSNLDNAPGLKQIQWLTTDRVEDEWADKWTRPTITPDMVGLLQYTSGSTGTPKGVVITHGNLMANCEMIVQSFEFTRDGCGMTWLPTYHDMGLLGGVLSPMYFGRPNVLMSPMAFMMKPVRWLRAITRYKVTVSGGPNFAYDLCNEKIVDEDCGGLDLSTWQVAFNGAEPIRPETLDAFSRKFARYGFRPETHYPCYGMAETTLIVTGGYKQAPPIIRVFDGRELDDGRVVPLPADHPHGRRLVGSGHARENVYLAIVNAETCSPAPAGRVGEIWVQSPSVGQGYWNKPEETERAFGGRLAGDEAAWLRTGDLGFIDGQQLFVTGRLKDMIIVRGVNRYPQDIESTIDQASDLVRRACSAAFAVELDGKERLIVVCEVERRRDAQWDEVIEKIRRGITLDHEIAPDAVILVKAGSIPKTSSGKVQRHICRDDFLEQKLAVVAEFCGWDR